MLKLPQPWGIQQLSRDDLPLTESVYPALHSSLDDTEGRTLVSSSSQNDKGDKKSIDLLVSATHFLYQMPQTRHSVKFMADTKSLMVDNV